MHRQAVALVAILAHLLLALAVDRGELGIVLRPRLLALLLHGLLLDLLRWRLLGITRIDIGRRIGHHIVLGIRLIGVVGAGGEKQQRTTHPDLTGIGRQAAYARTVGRGHDDIAWALWAIPIAA